MVFDVFCKKVPKKYPSKSLRLFVILFTPEILLWQRLFVQYCFGKGIFSRKRSGFCSFVAIITRVPREGSCLYSPGSPMQTSCPLYAISLPQNRRTNDGRFHSRTINKKNSKTNVRIIDVKTHIHTLTTTRRFFGYFADYN